MSIPSTALLALSCLVIQNAGLALLASYSFRPGAQRYSTQTVVFLSEVVKLVTSLFVEQRVNGLSLSQAGKFEPTRSRLALLLPSLLYVLQNNLQLYALKYLSPGVFVVMSQLKILTTALFSVVLLKRSLTLQQKFSIFLLTVGVIMIRTGKDGLWGSGWALQAPPLVALVCAVFISGFAGVVVEMSYKSEGDSMWMKNAWMSFFSLPAAFLLMQSDAVERRGALAGFNAVVCGVLLLKALGGLIVAAVLKYADNILKNFAVSISIIICYVWGAWLGNQVTYYEAFGSSIVILSIFLYSVTQGNEKGKFLLFSTFPVPRDNDFREEDPQCRGVVKSDATSGTMAWVDLSRGLGKPVLINATV